MSKTILFTIIGAITGLIVSEIADYTNSKNIEIALFAFTLLVGSFTLTWEKIPNKTLIKFLTLLTVVLIGITAYYFYQGYNNVRRISPIFVIALIQITVICTAFFQSWKSAKPHYSYSDLFENAWNNHFYYLFSGLLTSAFLLILLLGTTLFKSIGMRFLDKLIWNEQITPIIVLALIGAGVGISREYEQLIFKFRSIFFALFRILAYLTAIIVILFSLVLPFSIDALFSGKNTSQILLSIVAISIALLNAIEDKESKALPKWANWLFNIQIVLLPILTAVSIYAIYLRITQYGLMPNRIIAMWAALLIGAHALFYFIQTLLNKGQWSLGLGRVNPPLAIVWVISIVLLASPVLDPIKLSVNNQMARLKKDRVDLEKFDFSALKYRLGEPGKTAINEILKWADHPQYAEIKKLINTKTRRDKRVLSITVVGEAPANLEQLKKRYYSSRCNETTPCFIKMIKMNDKVEKQTMVFSFKNHHRNGLKLHSELYQYEKYWKILKRFNSDYIEKKQMATIIESIKKEEPSFIQPKYLDLEIDGVELRQ